jgi:mannose-1-phosphate guanylyltransferase / mannose-6-phosphate isomerase
MIDVRPVILCGGSGTRLWPLSRAGFPKQFLALTGTESLFQLAARRLAELGDSHIKVGNSLVVTNEEHRFLALEQLRETQLTQATFLLEPSARNTAAALTLAALQAVEGDADPVLVASPSDQHISDEAAYSNCLRSAITVAQAGKVVILGIKPDRPETGYGYIRFDQDADATGSHAVLQFVEKPDAQRAVGYLESGAYAWNSGMFVLKARVWLEALQLFRPDILAACEASWTARTRDDLAGQTGFCFVRPDAKAFTQVPSVSVDYAVMEKCPGSVFSIRMLSLNAGWSDLGAWDAVWKVSQTDAQGNVCRGDVLLDQAQGNFIHATHRLVSVVGVKDLAIIETADAVLIADKCRSQDVKNIVSQLQKSDRTEQDLHRKVHRPWGWYDNIDEGDGFKVKRIFLMPGASLSLQRHQHRSEHWVVVKGTAEVTCGENVMTLSENQSTYIPLGATHRLRNPASVDLEMIEVQSGPYLGDDDVVRLHAAHGEETL